MPVEVHRDAAALAERTADLFDESMRTAVDAAGRFAVALSGGKTPQLAYQSIARRADRAASQWAKTHVFWGDERCVSPDDGRSNERMARETLLERVHIPDAQVHPMRCADDADEAARRYEALLRAVLGARPRFDLVLLGLGDDGHTASLFPGSPLLAETVRRVAVASRPGESFRRLTLTLPVINRASRVVFLVAGEAKADALRRTLAGDREAPAARVRPEAGELYHLVDAAAASRLGVADETAPP